MTAAKDLQGKSDLIIVPIKNGINQKIVKTVKVKRTECLLN